MSKKKRPLFQSLHVEYCAAAVAVAEVRFQWDSVIVVSSGLHARCMWDSSRYIGIEQTHSESKLTRAAVLSTFPRR